MMIDIKFIISFEVPSNIYFSLKAAVVSKNPCKLLSINNLLNLQQGIIVPTAFFLDFVSFLLYF